MLRPHNGLCDCRSDAQTVGKKIALVDHKSIVTINDLKGDSPSIKPVHGE